MYKLQDFDAKYGDKGGVIALHGMIKEKRTLKFIGEHFGLTPQGIKYIIEKMLEKKYDPREDRKEKIISQIIVYARSHSERETREAYQYSEYYCNIAIAECYIRGIYKERPERDAPNYAMDED